MKQVFDFIRYSIDKKRLRELVVSNLAYRGLAEDAYDVAVEFTGVKELIDAKGDFEKGGEVDMCKALTEMLQDERTEGRRDVLISLVKEGILSLADAASRMGMSEENFARHMEAYSEN